MCGEEVTKTSIRVHWECAPRNERKKYLVFIFSQDGIVQLQAVFLQKFQWHISADVQQRVSHSKKFSHAVFYSEV